MIEVPTVTALLDTARVFATQPLMGGNRVVVLSNARSPEVLATATLAAAGLEVVPSPIALDWRSQADDYAAAITAALDDADVDAIFIVHAPPVVDAIGQPIEAIEAASAGAAKPIVAVMLGSSDGPLQRGSSIPAFAFPEQAAAALGRIAAYSRWRRMVESDHDLEPPAQLDQIGADAIIAEHLSSGTMAPGPLRELLTSYGVTMPRTELVDIDDAVAAAEAVGYPAAVKSTRRRVGRSAEAGIALDLSEAADVVEAVRIMRQHLGEDARQVLVQPMVSPGLDLRIHIRIDARIGPVITVGLGGVQADLIGDESSRLAPISPSVARSLVASTKAAAMLDEDALDTVADIVSRIAQLASDHPEIAELDLNPVIVGDDGCRVVDGKITLRAPERPEPAVRRLE